jgi:hypothetical protein
LMYLQNSACLSECNLSTYSRSSVAEVLFSTDFKKKQSKKLQYFTTN